MGKEALVVPRDVLFGGDEFQGFMPVGKRDFLSIILKDHRYEERGERLERNYNLQQIIPYVWIVSPLEKKVFLYKRKVTEKPAGEFVETRYLNKYSGGVGGHIDRDTEEGSVDPITKAMMRELEEEVEFESGDLPFPKVVGFVNDDVDELSKVHFGVVAVAEYERGVKARDDEGLEAGEFYSIGEVDSIFADESNVIETWTKISWPFVRGYLEKL